MELFKNIKTAFKSAGGAMQSAVGVMAEKNRRSALANRLRTVIRCEEKAAERAYLALGRYYYNNMRDAANAETESYCMGIEVAEKRIEEAMRKLEELVREESEETVSEEETTLDEIRELPLPAAEEAVPEGFIDEAVESVGIAVEESASEKDASEDLPYA